MKNLLLKLIAVTLVAAGAVAAEEKAEQRAAVRKPPIPLHVQVAIARYQGENRVSTLPYTLALTANDGRTARVRSGIMVPLVTRTEHAHDLVFKSVGANIGCSAESQVDGSFRLDLSVDLETVVAGDGPISWAASDAPLGKHTVLREVSADLSLVLRGGQTVQHIAAADPQTGETVKIEVTLSVVK